MSDAKARVRWRMTLDELAYATKVSPITLEEWAQLGAYGPRWKENRDRGKWRHITREVAQRAVVMSRLVRAGLTTITAADIARTHEVGDDMPLYAHQGEVTLIVKRNDLP